MKSCSKCNLSKNFSEFHKSSRSKDGFSGICRECDNARKRAHYLTPEGSAYKAKHRKDNAERNIAYSKAYREENKEELKAKRDSRKERKKELDRVYCQENKEKIAAKSARRRAYRTNATPNWASKEAILEIYAEARRLTEETGIQHHVDHIIPLKSKIVSGLHCEANLQILTFSENCSKSNVVWPDMP